MANTKISALPSGSPAQATDALPIARAGANFSLAVSDISAAAPVQTVAGKTGAVTLAGGDITSGVVALARGGTNVDLSASGSSTAVLAQDASHVVSARSLVAGDIPNLSGAVITSGKIGLAQGGTNVDLSATGSATAVLAQDGSHVVSARSLIAADIPNLAGSIITSGTVSSTVGGVNVVSTAGQGCLVFPSDAALLNAGANRAAMTANTMKVWQFNLDRKITFTKVSINVVTTSSTNHEYIGIYNAAGSSLLVQASFTLGAGTGVLTATVGSTTLTPGTYWLGTSPDQGTSVITGVTTLGVQVMNLFNAVATRYGTSSLSTSGGVMPASIGTLTPIAGTTQPPIVIFEP